MPRSEQLRFLLKNYSQNLFDYKNIKLTFCAFIKFYYGSKNIYCQLCTGVLKIKYKTTIKRLKISPRGLIHSVKKIL